MIKMIGLLTRRPELTHEEFVHHWLLVHGPLARAVPGVRRYVQSHIIGTRTRPDIPETDVQIDGIAELWYDDMAGFERAAASAEMKRLTDDGALIRSRLFRRLADRHCLIRQALDLRHVHTLDPQQPGSGLAFGGVQHADVVQVGVARLHHVVVIELRLARR